VKTLAIIKINNIKYIMNKIVGLSAIERLLHSLIELEVSNILLQIDQSLSITEIKKSLTNKVFNKIWFKKHLKDIKININSENAENITSYDKIILIDELIFFDYKLIKQYLAENTKSSDNLIFTDKNNKQLMYFGYNVINVSTDISINSMTSNNPYKTINIGNAISKLTQINDFKNVKKYLFSYKPKPTDGIIDWIIYRRISKLFTRFVFIHLPLTPNMITVLSILVSVIGIGLVAFLPDWEDTIIGLGVLAFAPVFDCCDGEIARLRFQFSKVGEWLDSISDDIINILLILGVSYKLSFSSGITFLEPYRNYIFYAGVLSSIFLLVHNSYIYYYLLRIIRSGSGVVFGFHWWFEEGKEKEPKKEYICQKHGEEAKLSIFDLSKFLTRRDFFIFMFFFLSIFKLVIIPLVVFFCISLVVFVLTVLQIILYKPSKS